MEHDIKIFPFNIRWCDTNRPLRVLRVIIVKFPPQPHQKHYITQYKERGFHSLLRWKMIILQIPATSLIHFLFNRLGECTFWS